MPTLSREDEIDLVEYRKAQDSAQHHTMLGWTITAIVWAGSLSLLGFILSKLGGSDPPELLAVPAALALVMNVVACAIDGKLFKVARFKYHRCKDLERKRFGRERTGQHSQSPHVWPRLRHVYIFVTCLFVVVWLIVLIHLLAERLGGIRMEIIYDLGVASLGGLVGGIVALLGAGCCRCLQRRSRARKGSASGDTQTKPDSTATQPVPSSSAGARDEKESGTVEQASPDQKSTAQVV